MIEEPAETLPPTMRPAWAFDQFVLKALVIALTVVVLDELRDRPAEMAGSSVPPPE